MQMARSLKAESDYEAKGARPRGKTVGVRLSAEEFEAADAIAMPGEKVASVLRRLLNERMARQRKSRPRGK